MKYTFGALVCASILAGCGSDSSGDSVKPETTSEKIARYFNVDSTLIETICSEDWEFTCEFKEFDDGEYDAKITSKHLGFIQRIDTGNYYSYLSANITSPDYVLDGNETLKISYSSNHVNSYEHEINDFEIDISNGTHNFIISNLISYDYSLDRVVVDNTYLPLLNDLSYDFSHNGVRVIFMPDDRGFSVYNDEPGIQSFFKLLSMKVEENA
uniref:hypothetical protein n=1 Tax=Thaumasiovibrio occultus TaxID=1891184 RepID=UPI000B34FC77|nr:hypothetical protein [Thaumasiovibrio occultus]